ncbi:MAG: helicase [Candidatus Sericytochromatia bacterium]|nr:MAG: helicase [Candidatus Sericytochromatia bacterium]
MLKNSRLKFGNEIDVFYYRSDLISDEQKDKIIDFRNYDNNGDWYIILDEAHKGDKQESKRQHFYSILSRNGFLLNFSATFTDPIDFATCVFNFNLAKFIEEGYGKHIYVSKENISSLGEKEDFKEIDKQRILLKILILQAFLNKQYQEIKKIDSNLYHKPLLVTLVNSVNTEDSDLELFFRELKKVAIGEIKNDIFNIAKEELKKELSNEKYEFENKEVNIRIEEIDKIDINFVLKYVFNTDTHGKIEIIKMPKNQQELLFKMQTSNKPFALMKIGDISTWLKQKLDGYEINEKFENESVFRNIDKNDDVNILMGSRSFYEGWDSNRPNIILFINIGKGIDAKKFVLQAIGRGVRIEPIPNRRVRGLILYNNNEIGKDVYEKVKDKIDSIETLFVFGTKSQNLKDIVETLKKEKSEEVLLGDLFEINPEIESKLLLIPVYKTSDSIIVEDQNVIKFSIHLDDLKLAKNYFNYIGYKISLIKYDCDIRVLKEIKKVFNNEESEGYFFKENENATKFSNPDLLLKNIFNHFSNKAEEFRTFKEVEKENEIIHFKKIVITKDILDSVKEKIENVEKTLNREKELDEQFDREEITREEYKKKLKEIKTLKEEVVVYSTNEKLKITLLQNHYYIPVIVKEIGKADYIKHIIKTDSEVKFLNDLEKYLQEENNFFNEFDWWYFSKLDETLDKIYIPYYNPKNNKIDKFKPDFIFWLKKGNDYTILFVDPKGTEHTDGYRKIDGYSRLFEIQQNEEKQPKVISYNGFNIKVKLLMKTDEMGNVIENYKNYWFNELEDLIKHL